MRRRWIREAIENPGALRRYVRRKLGKKGFTKKGTLRVSELRKLLSGKYGRITETTKRRIRLALKLRRL